MEKLHILVVDDEPGMRLGVQRALRDYSVTLPDLDLEIGFDVDLAETAEEGLQKLNETPFDLILLDLKLPGMSGLEALGKILTQEHDLLVIMITAFASIETAVSATKQGAFDFLAKPFTPKELMGTLQKAVEYLVLSRRARKMAEEKKQVRFQFISVLAHELKAPLGAIEGYLNIMDSYTLGEQLSAYNPMIKRSLYRINGMRKMILDLTDLTRIESGKKIREATDIDLCRLVRTAIETVIPDAGAKRITIQMESPDQLWWRADRSEMEMILNNLITNSVKYNRDQGRVDIKLEAKEEQAIITVSDTGIGMTPEESQKLFNEFVRIRNEKTKDILGSGLGLSIVKKLVELNGGEVFVRSEPDVGSTFTVRLKKSREEAIGE